MKNVKLFILFALLVAATAILFIGSQYRHQAKLAQVRKDARTAMLKKDWSGGKQLCRRWLDRSPGNADALLLLAQAHSELKEWKQLVETLGKVPASDPRYAAALIEKSEVEWSALNLPFEGLQTAQEAVKYEPKAIQAHARIIAFFAMTFQRSKMISAIRDAIRSEGEPREAYLYLVLADEPVFVNAIDLNSRWLSAAPDSEQFRVGLAIQMALHVFLDAVAQAKEEAFEKEKEALQRLGEFSEQYPGNIELLSVMLEHAIEEGNRNKVGQLLQQVPKESVQDHMIWTAKGWFHTARDELEPAEAAFQKALQLHPSSERAQHEYASLLRLKGQIQLAQNFQEKARVGTELRKKILKLENARQASEPLMKEIQDYFDLCGDKLVARALGKRLMDIQPETQP